LSSAEAAVSGMVIPYDICREFYTRRKFAGLKINQAASVA
jgi:hypothetical protein